MPDDRRPSIKIGQTWTPADGGEARKITGFDGDRVQFATDASRAFGPEGVVWLHCPRESFEVWIEARRAVLTPGTAEDGSATAREASAVPQDHFGPNAT